MDRIHHVKLVSHQPDAVRRFLTEVVNVPSGWTLGAAPPEADTEAPDAQDPLDWDEVFRFRNASEAGGFMVGDQQSRQFQVLFGEQSHLWSVAIATRDLEGAHQRSIDRGIPVTEPRLFEFETQSVRAFFARVGGLLLEVMRVEPANAAPADASASSATT